MAAERRAHWEQVTWDQPPEAHATKAPSQMTLVALKSQAEAFVEVTQMDVDAILLGVRIGEAARAARVDWLRDFIEEEGRREARAQAASP